MAWPCSLRHRLRSIGLSSPILGLAEPEYTNRDVSPRHVRRQYLRHCDRGNMLRPPARLWHRGHLLDKYPTVPISPHELPDLAGRYGWLLWLHNDSEHVGRRVTRAQPS